MDAKATLYKNTLVLKYRTGIDENDNPKYSTQRFSRISLNATDDAIHTVGSLMLTMIASNNKELLKEEFYTLSQA